MKLQFHNLWKGNSMKPGGCFPIEFIDIYVDINPSYRFFQFTILNFTINIDMGR